MHTLDRIADAVRRRRSQHSELLIPPPEFSPVHIVSDQFTYPRTTEFVARTRSGELLPGKLPATPPTLRGGVGALIVRVVQRMLAWYTPGLIEAQHLQADAASETLAALRESGREKQELLHALVVASKRIDHLEASFTQLWNLQKQTNQEAGQQHQSLLSHIETDRSENQARVSLGMAALADQIESLTIPVDSLKADVGRIDVVQQATVSGIDELRAEVRKHALAAYAGSTSLFESVQEAKLRLDEQRVTLQLITEAIDKLKEEQQSGATTADRYRSEMADQAHKLLEHEFELHQLRSRLVLIDTRVSLLIQELRRSVKTPASPAPPAPETGSPAALSDVYVALQDAFRGDRKEVKARLNDYLPHLAKQYIGSMDRPVVDLGCGRGEWLELLYENGLSVVGVDSNFGMIEHCRMLGLAATLNDGLAYLKEVPTSSLGAITAFHLIEHIPFDGLSNLFEEALRVLKPGGLIIFETPNCENLLVGACTFYLDPTHRKPLHPSLMRFFAEAKGFVEVQIFPMHPYPDSFKVPGDSDVARVINDRFFGCQDYALIALRP